MASITTAAAFTLLSGGKGRNGGGVGAIWRYPLLAAGIFIASWNVYYAIFSRRAGWTYDKYNEFQYARVFK